MKKTMGMLLGLMMIASGFTIAVGTATAADTSGTAPLALYPAFRIDSNAGFAAHASSGNGGNTNPWIIENKDVDATDLGYGIYIGNTTDHFILRNCTVWGASGVGSSPYYADAGMIVYNITKGNIDNCTFHNNSGSGMFISTNVRNVTVNGTHFADNLDGIETWNTRNSRFSNLTCIGNTESGMLMNQSQNINVTYSLLTGNLNGIHLSYSNGFLLTDNNASGNAENGVILEASNNNDAINNTVWDNMNGIMITQFSTNGSTMNDISGNVIDGNDDWGIEILGPATQLNTISGNNISGNIAGIDIYYASNNTVLDNWISDNFQGIAIGSGYNNSIYHNHFIGNVLQASDDGVNQWNDAYPSGGNYWSDYSGVDIMSGSLQDQPGSDSFGDTPYVIDADSADHYPLWFPADVDLIRIVDGPNGTGNPAGTHEYATPWFNITLWAAAYNDTLGYVRDIWVNWTNVNFAGALSTIANASGYSTTWQAGPNEGVALLTAAHSSGMTCDVNVTIATYQPDLMIDGKTDDVYENPPVTQISWRNMTQGGSAPFDVLAENDGITPGSFTLVWDTSGLPGTFDAVMLNDDLHTNVTSSMNTGVSFILNPGASMNFTLLINSSTTAGFGQTGTVNIGLFPPNGEQDSAGAIAQICEPDYILLTDSPGGTALTSVSLQIGLHVTAYASAYNATGPSYLGLVPVNWADSPDLGTFGNATGTSSSYTATAPGTTTITGTSTGLGLSDTFTVVVSPPADGVPPISSVNPIGTYWLNTSPLEITANASDDDSGVSNVTLRYRFSGDNITWGSWSGFHNDLSAPWAWDFDFPDGQGYYEFFSIARDISGNSETAPSQADAACAFDDIQPTIAGRNGGAGVRPGETVQITATLNDSVDMTWPLTVGVSDNMALKDVYLTYYMGNEDEVNVTMTGNDSVRSCSIAIPTYDFDYLWVMFSAVDFAQNWNSMGYIGIVLLAPPTADAGDDMTLDIGGRATFNGTGSTDNFEITNYTWTFTYNGTAITLWDATPEFTFWTPGTYNITLIVIDSTGLNDTDIVQVSVNPPLIDDDQDWPMEICWIGLILLVILALLLLLLFLRRRKKNEPEETPPGAMTGSPAREEGGGSGSGGPGEPIVPPENTAGSGQSGP